MRKVKVNDELLDIVFDPPVRNLGKPINWIIIDSLIIAGIAMVARLPEHIPNIEELYIAFKTFLYAFLIQLAVERGLKPYAAGRAARKAASKAKR